jgi:glycosyltransferase involved in cell wall biosynthesis
MIRVLHLLDPCPDFQTRRTHDSLRHEIGADFRIDTRTLGRGGDYRNLPTAIARLRREPVDLIHAWGMTALAAAVMAGCPRVLFNPDRFAGPRTLRWVRAVLGNRNAQMICSSATQRRVAVEHGVPLQRCHLIRPGVEFSRIHRRRDDALRAALGLKPDDFVMLAPGESTRAAAHDEAVWACGILNVLDPRCKLLLWGQGERASAAAALGHRLHQPDLVKVAERLLNRSLEFEELLPATDACLVTAKGPVATLPIAICMAAALPIVSTVTYTVAELLEDHHTALMVPHRSPRLIAQRVMDLRIDPSLQWSIADMARTEAYEFFSLTRMLNQYRAAYQQLAAGKTVEVPEPIAGAGLRFHGRG